MNDENDENQIGRKMEKTRWVMKLTKTDYYSKRWKPIKKENDEKRFIEKWTEVKL